MRGDSRVMRFLTCRPDGVTVDLPAATVASVATARINDGDRIPINGSTGVVEILKS
jgi:hypothetical protein